MPHFSARQFASARSVVAAPMFTPKGTSLTLNRLGYGAIGLSGPMAWGQPKDRQGLVGLLREAVRLGVNHIDTADYYGPHIANDIIYEALYPYPKDLVIATKVGTRRGADKSWLPALSPKQLTSAVHDNLRRLGLERLDIVNLRVGGALGPNAASIEAPLATLVKLQDEGLIRHLGLSNISYSQWLEADKMATIICVQNLYNLGHRNDDALIDLLAARQIAFVPFFPLGGFRPLQSEQLATAAAALGATTRQLALAWLLHRAPNILIIAGTSSITHLRQNLAAAALKLPPPVITELDAVSAELAARQPGTH